MNMRTVVLDDCPRPVNDLLVAFDLRDDLLLHFQRRQRDLKDRVYFGLEVIELP